MFLRMNQFGLLIRMDASEKKLAIVGAIRTVSFCAILLIGLFFQFKNSHFSSVDVSVPLYLIVFTQSALTALYFIFGKKFGDRIWIPTALLFVLDAFAVTALIYVTGVSQSIFFFMYLVNIALAGILFQRAGAVTLALLTSVLFSLLLVVSPTEIRGQSLYFVVGLNNLAFLAIAVLSGFLSEQLNLLGAEIIERDEAIQGLKDLNELIIENISTGLMTIDSSYRIIQMNRAAMDILSLSAPVTSGTLISSLVPEISPQLIGLTATTSDHKIGRFEVGYVNSKEEKLVLGGSLSRLTGKKGFQQGHILIFQDLTQIKRMEKAIRRNDKLAAVGQLAAGIAHEIRNPLASISGSVQLMGEMNPNQSPEEKKLTSIVLREIDRLNNLISEFLDFVRPDTKLDEVVDLEELLKESLQMLELNTKVRKDVRQDVDLQCHQSVYGNSSKLKQVFLNLLINAYQAMEGVEQPVLTVRTRLRGGLVEVRIRDSGSGMPEAVMNRLFEPFHTTKPQGTGLGLATTHKILESHDAQISVESVVGQGTEFVIEFTRLAGLQEPAPDLTHSFNEEMNRFNLRKKRGQG